MKLVLKGLILLNTIEMFGLWLTWMISPETAEGLFQVDAVNITGMNSLKGDYAGLFLALGVFLVLFFIKGKQWLYPPAIALICIVFGRMISLLVDGYDQQGAIGGLIELIIAIIFITVAQSSPSDTNDSSESLPQ